MQGIRDIELALATVQRVLDRLTATGHSEAAFDIARAEFTASLRASFPGNLGSLARAIDHALAREELGLTGDEREDLRRAADVLRRAQHP